MVDYAGAAVGTAFGELFALVKHLVKTVAAFRGQLRKIQTTLGQVEPIIKIIDKYNDRLNRGPEEMAPIKDLLEDGKALVDKCSRIQPGSVRAKYAHSKRLTAFNAAVVEKFQLYMLLLNARDDKEMLVDMKQIGEDVKEVKDMLTTVILRSGAFQSGPEALGHLAVPAAPDFGADFIVRSEVEESSRKFNKVGMSEAASEEIATTSMTPIALISAHEEKPEKFNGTDFKRWQQKMLFYLTTLNLARFLTEDAPKLNEGEVDKETFVAIDAWKHSDFLCRNYILNGMDNSLCNIYSSSKTAKELWDSLDKKYNTKDAGLKKFIVGKFLDFKMVDFKTVLSQVQELQVILHDIHAEGMMISESFQVAAFIEKLPPSWKDFKNYLKHKRNELSLEDLIVRLRIEEDNRLSKKKVGSKLEVSRANIVEEGSKPNKKRKKFGEESNQGLKKFFGKCYNCEKSGHHAKDCRAKKRKHT